LEFSKWRTSNYSRNWVWTS